MRENIESLQGLLNKHEQLTHDIEALKLRKKELLAERERLIQSGRLEDEKTVARATSLATQADMVPYRVTALEQALEDLGQALGRETCECVKAFDLALEARHEKALGLLAAALGPFCADPRAAAERVFDSTRMGEDLAPIRLLRHRWVGDMSRPVPPAFHALEILRSLAALKPL